MSRPRRLQVLLDAEQYFKLQRAAALSGESMASVAREAIDRHLRTIDADRAVKGFLVGTEVDVEDWHVMKARMEDEIAHRAPRP